MRLNKQNKIIVGVLAFLLTLTVGYAVFSQSINITGTAEASGNFSLIFSSIGTIKEEGSSGTTADIISEGKTLSVKVPNLQYPSAYAKINANITNDGTVKAILKEIVITDKNGNAYNDNDIKITYSNIKINDIFEPNESKDVAIIVTWDKDSTNSKVDASFNISLKYIQATSLADSSGGGTSSESDWTFETNDTGVITAYNYEKGTDVVVPAEVGGIPVTTITEDSFKQESNLIVYMDEDAGKMYMVIKEEEEQNFLVVKEKIINLMLLSNECTEDDTDCISQTKQMIYVCTDENTCYNVKAEEEGNAEAESISQAVIENGAEQMVVDTDPNVSLEESFDEPKANISTLDLSQATNLTAIEEDSFYKAGLQSVNFGENSNLKTIGASAFSKNEISELVIPESVEEIGNSAFSSNNITSVTFKQNDNALANNSSIKASYLSKNVNNKTSKLKENSTGLKTIGNSAFSSNQISSIELPNTITSIGSNAFYKNQLTSITIPNNVITIGEYAFYENQISSLLFEENSSLKTIEWSAFSGNQISSLIIPDGVTKVGQYAFYQNKISTLKIPKTVETIGSYAFTNNVVETLSIGKCTTDICKNNSFGTQVKTLTIESGEIGDSAFSSSSDSTTKIESLTLGDEVTSIGYQAFYNNNITSITLPNSITTIENYAFKNNQISGGIVIPSSMTSLSGFENNKISSITFEENSNLTYLTGFANNEISKLIVPEGVNVIEYKAFNENSISTLSLPTTLTSMGEYAFSNNPIETLSIGNCTADICRASKFGTQIKTLKIEGGDIPSSAFAISEDTATKIEKLTLGYNVKSIGSKAFYNNNIKDLTIGKCTTDICSVNIYSISDPSYLPFGTNIETLEIKSGEIGDYAFAGFGDESNTKVISLTLGEGVTEIGTAAFSYIGLNGNIKVPSTVTEIKERAFFNNEITGLTFEKNSSLKTIGNAAFRSNQIEGELIIPNNVEEIDNQAFEYNQISSLTFENDSKLITIGEEAFYSNQISSLALPDELVYVNESAFKSNQISGNLIIPSSVTNIEAHAFDSNQISELTIPKSVTSIGYEAFYSNPLTSILIKRTEEDFLANVTVGSGWYSNSPTITYQEEE